MASRPAPRRPLACLRGWTTPAIVGVSKAPAFSVSGAPDEGELDQPATTQPSSGEGTRDRAEADLGNEDRPEG